MLPRIAMVSTFPPTQCGIATFAESLTRELTHTGASVEMVDLPGGPESPPHDAILHRHRGFQDLRVTGYLLDSFDAVILQHEFGIWDGPDGHGIVDLIGALATPVITVLHTVPSVATGGQRCREFSIFQTRLWCCRTLPIGGSSGTSPCAQARSP